MRDASLPDGLIRGATVTGDSVVLGLRRWNVPAKAATPAGPRSPLEEGRSDTVLEGGGSVGGGKRVPVPGLAQPSTMPAQASPVIPLPAGVPEEQSASVAAKREEEQSELLRIREEARRMGRDEGRAEGLKEIAGQREADARKLRQLLDSIPHALHHRLVEMEGEIADLAFVSVCKMLGSAAVDREFALRAVREVLGKVKSARRVRIGVAPADIKLLSTLDVQSLLPSGAIVILEVDAAVSLGGCIISTDSGEWDGRLETQLARLHEILRAGDFSPPGEHDE